MRGSLSSYLKKGRGGKVSSFTPPPFENRVDKTVIYEPGSWPSITGRSATLGLPQPPEQ